MQVKILVSELGRYVAYWLLCDATTILSLRTFTQNNKTNSLISHYKRVGIYANQAGSWQSTILNENGFPLAAKWVHAQYHLLFFTDLRHKIGNQKTAEAYLDKVAQGLCRASGTGVHILNSCHL